MRLFATTALCLLATLAFALPAQAARDVCNTQVAGNESTGVYTHDCHATVSEDTMDCLWGEQWNTYTVGPLTVRYTSCTSPYPDH
ncbi:MAG: hypothetical protein QOI63_669 [Thermoplasmata archaeon]|jgi:hypothetical protein|nr:hypothetical protein [Thermoplasmata archaeon]